MKKFNTPYLQIVRLDSNETIKATCVLECSCDIESCTCDLVCGCDNDCLIYIDPSK